MTIEISRLEHNAGSLRCRLSGARSRRWPGPAEVNGEAMSLHLAEINKHVHPGAHAVITLDGAGGHQSGGQLRVPDNISLLPLPPYSPEWNPVQNI